MGEQGTCPCCQSDNLEYGAVEFYDDQCYFPRTCNNCKVEGEERYSLDFIGHENLYDKDGNEVLFNNKKKDEN